MHSVGVSKKRWLQIRLQSFLSTPEKQVREMQTGQAGKKEGEEKGHRNCPAKIVWYGNIRHRIKCNMLTIFN